MYNNHLYNRAMYNGTINLNALAVSDDRIAFNGFSISNGSTIVASDLYIEPIERDFITSNAPNASGQIVNNSYWRSKRIRISGNITADTEIELEQLIFDFKKNLSALEGRLEIKMADGSVRRYICTQIKDEMVQRGRHFHVTTAPFDVEFECSSPFGTALATTSEGFIITDLVYNGALTNEGNAQADVDLIFILNAADTINRINVENTTTGEEIEIEAAFSAGNVLVISGKNKTVTIDGVEQDFTGSFITANVGENNYTLTATGVSVEYELTTNTPKNFL